MTTAIRRAAEDDADAEYEPLIDRGLVHVIGDPIEGENLGLYARLGYEETDRATAAGFARVYLRKRLVVGRPG